MGRGDDDPDRLSKREVHGVLDQMCDADWKRAERFADIQARGLLGTSGEDLLGEVCVQLLGEERRFPRGARPLVVLKNAIRSEASNARKSSWERRRDHSVGVEPECDPDTADGFEESRPIAPGAVDGTTPEAELLAKEQLDNLLASMADDPEAELVMLAWADGLRGAEGIAATGLDANVYDAARKRLLRKHEAIDRHGEEP